ncbi:MAG TPA: DNA internalization-related competence protein ComEC/Rec2 [Peptococcaceae bacterium]|nr:DNA internalization-related competence protein ComEC/Rec2 [Peptococcaceae bacterium]
MKDKLSKLLAALLLGGFLAVYSHSEVRILILAFFLLLLFRLWRWWKPQDFVGRLIRPEILLLACSLVVGYVYGLNAEKSLAEPLVIEEITIKGLLQDWVRDQSSGRGVLAIEELQGRLGGQSERGGQVGLGAKYTLRVYQKNGLLPAGWESVRPGDLIRITGRLEHPKPPGTPGEFDLPLYNAVRGLSGTITTREEVQVLAKGNPGLVWQIREEVRNVLDEYWPLEAGVLEGILFGDTSRIPDETLERYKATGVMHVFAASGANVAFVLALVWGIFFFLPRKGRILAAMSALILYAALCQGNPPILRATILGLAVLTGMMGRGKMDPLRWLLLAALILFIIEPLYLKDVSFQLSFAATWGMIVLVPKLKETAWLQKLPKLLRPAVEVSLAAQIAALPILISVFNRISLAGFVTNVFVLFILGAVLQLGLIGTTLLFLPVLPLAFFQTAFWLLQFTDAVLKIVAVFPWGYFWVLRPGIFFWVVWYGALGVWLLGKEKAWFIVRVQVRRIRNLAARISKRLFLINKEQAGKIRNFTLKLPSRQVRFFLVVLLLLGFLWVPSLSRERLEITFLDVGQGDCILLQTSKEKIMVDAGPRTASFDAGERVVVPYLMQQRIAYLDMVFITHEDSDHLGGARYLLANIPVGKVAVPEVGERLTNEAWQEGLPPEILSDAGGLLRLKAGDIVKYSSGLSLEVLAPDSVIAGTGGDSNNNSLVLLLKFLGWAVLLTGDMEQEEMQQISDRGWNYAAHFIKIPHHGSKGSFDPFWFDRTNPQAVFIQVGRNSFGHPAPEVISYWQERGIPVYRTDLQGTIRLQLDEDGFTIIPGRD